MSFETHDEQEELDEQEPSETVRSRSLPIAGATRGHISAVRALDHWYVLAMSSEVKQEPLVRTLYDTPIVLFRGRDGAVAALLDRCPHRNVPLSMGRVREDSTLECPYHGWRFDRRGACTHIPSLCEDARAKDSPAWRATAFSVREIDGWIWVYARPFIDPSEEPLTFSHLSDPRYTHVYQRTEAEGTLLATAENALDVPHTQFLHRGLFRSDSRGITVEAIVRASSDRVEAEYVGEPRPPGLVAKILSPSGGIVEHFDRFIAPCITQVEYKLGDENHVLVTSALTPVSEAKTMLFSVVSLRLRIPARMLVPVLEPLALKIFQQDAVMLKAQSETIRRFGGEQFATTEIDVLGKHIWKLLRACERGPVLRGQSLREVSRARLVL
jgi:phenylpropionate dioxygenase-like ring-hydroxylating dioxygenase large terminal subunit